MLTCVDLVSTDTDNFIDVVNASLDAIDYLFVNEVEASRACGMPLTQIGDCWGEKQAIVAARSILERGVHQAVVVHSPNGALWSGQDGTCVWSIPEPVPTEQIASTVGAGDAFCAGALYAIHEGWSAEHALQLAHRAAGASLTGRTATDGIPQLSELVNG